ncbi:hypothetical protein SUNI508_03966 [Seiridium unicorne]|uniref:Uncharacterized protein n=1 Tax=Seiridium unicorne TaxID=138068 RepID=A0ABR2V999_9PEZI
MAEDQYSGASRLFFRMGLIPMLQKNEKLRIGVVKRLLDFGASAETPISYPKVYQHELDDASDDDGDDDDDVWEDYPPPGGTFKPHVEAAKFDSPIGLCWCRGDHELCEVLRRANARLLPHGAEEILSIPPDASPDTYSVKLRMPVPSWNLLKSILPTGFALSEKVKI